MGSKAYSLNILYASINLNIAVKNTEAEKIHNNIKRHGIKIIIAKKKRKVSERSISPDRYVITLDVLSTLLFLVIPPTIKNIEIQRIIAAKENIPAHIRFRESEATSEIIIDISTNRSQNISIMPPNVVGPSYLATEPSIVSMTKEIETMLTEDIIMIINNPSKRLLRYIKNEPMKPKISPIIVS